MARHKKQEIKGEILEMVLGFFLCSDWVNDAIAHMHGALIRNLLHSLQDNNNVLGMLRVLLPLLLFAAFYFLRKLLAHLVKPGRQAYQRIRARIEAKRKPRSQAEDEI